MSALKECPFCGYSNELYVVELDEKLPWVAGCGMCGACIHEPTSNAAIAAWNRRADGWQPIETAPRVDKKPLLLARVGVWACEGFWYEFDKVWHNDFTYGRVGSEDGIAPPPTHWQPLPPPPTTGDPE